MKNKQEKIKTGTTGIEELEGKENELDAITNVFLENAEPDEIRVREMAQEELQEFIEKATKEEIDYAQSLIRLKGTQYRDWTKGGFPMKEIKISRGQAMENKSGSDIEREKIIFETKKVPAILLTLTEDDIKMIEISNNPDKLDKLTGIKKEFVEKWLEKYEGFAISDEQTGEMQKFVNAHEKLPENRANEIQTLVSRAFPEFNLKQREWKKKEEKEKKEDIDLSQFKPEIDYAA